MHARRNDDDQPRLRVSASYLRQIQLQEEENRRRALAHRYEQDWITVKSQMNTWSQKENVLFDTFPQFERIKRKLSSVRHKRFNSMMIDIAEIVNSPPILNISDVERGDFQQLHRTIMSTDYTQKKIDYLITRIHYAGKITEDLDFLTKTISIYILPVKKITQLEDTIEKMLNYTVDDLNADVVEAEDSVLRIETEFEEAKASLRDETTAFREVFVMFLQQNKIQPVSPDTDLTNFIYRLWKLDTIAMVQSLNFLFNLSHPFRNLFNRFQTIKENLSELFTFSFIAYSESQVESEEHVQLRF